MLNFSSNQPHPLAEQPIIFITSMSLVGYYKVRIEIVGEYLALLITFSLVQDAKVDMFFLVRWKKGVAHFVSVSQSLPSVDTKRRLSSCAPPK